MTSSGSVRPLHRQRPTLGVALAAGRPPRRLADQQLAGPRVQAATLTVSPSAEKSSLSPAPTPLTRYVQRSSG